MLNEVVLMGFLGADPEIRYLPNGTAVCKLRVAIGERWKDQSGAVKDKTHWVGAFAFGKTAENLGKFFHKGSKVIFKGSLDYSEWTDSKDGSKRNKLEVKVSGFEFVESKKDSDPQPAATPASYQPAPGYAPVAPPDDDEIPF